MSEHHDEVGRFMAAIQPGGAAEAARLSGLSLRAGLALAIQRHQFSECGSTLYPRTTGCPLPHTVPPQRTCAFDARLRHVRVHVSSAIPQLVA